MAGTTTAERKDASKNNASGSPRPKRSLFTTPVMVQLIDGRREEGAIGKFIPSLPNLLLQRRSDGQRVQVPAERIAFVAFLQNPGSALHEEPGQQSKELRIHISGGKTFLVRTDPAHLSHPLGFFGVPSERNSSFQEVYFYAAAVNAKEDATALGSLLLEGGALDRSALNRGVANQQTDRKIPIGQILVQQDKVSADKLDEAITLQNRKRLRLGEVLVELGMVTDGDIQNALREQKNRRGKRIGEVLVELGVLQESALFRTLARKFHMPFVDLDEIAIDGEAIHAVKREVIQKYGILPLEERNGVLTIAISDPLQTEIYDILRFGGSLRIQEVLVVPSQLKRYVENYLEQGRESEVNAILKAMEAEDEGRHEIELKDTDSKVVRLANQIIIDAWRQGASDIHIEPNGKEQNTIIRYRTDGECSIYKTVPAGFRASLVARLKIMAELDISERRKPQDGKIKFSTSDKKIELRVATIPTAGGNEDVVMRILASSKPLPLSKMGMSERNLQAFQTAVKKPYGLILCVGPTGSGKTTTLHSALGYINHVERKIWTAEDPVEITQPGLRQVQVHPKIGYTFASAIRAFLRADPDVIMIGEMRDTETASIGVEASLTGHLVFSTLHTNTAPETITRLLDMGLDPFTFADSLEAVLAQRLARALCKQCRQPVPGDEDSYQEIVSRYGREALKSNVGVRTASDLRLWKGAGCLGCYNTGNKGRVPLHELLIASDDIREAIQSKATAEEIRFLAIQAGMTTLVQDGIEKVVAGKTDLKQVLAVCSR